MKRYIFREEAKCNFCSEWFVVFNEIKYPLKICENCINKAIHTSYFKVPGPNHDLYQVYLVKKHTQINQQSEQSPYQPILQMIDEHAHQQFKNLTQKWLDIVELLKQQSKKFTTEELVRYKTIFQSENEKFDELKEYLVNQIQNKPVQKNFTNFSTPLRDKKQTNNVQSCARMKKNNSKQSLNSIAKENHTLSLKRSIYLNASKNQCSPFNLCSQSRDYSSVRLDTNPDFEEHKLFTSQMHKLKNSIGVCLENEHSVNPVLHNIMKQKIYEAIQNTSNLNKCIELVSYQGLQDIDMKCYLKNLDWEGIEVAKFVRVGLNDDQLKYILLEIENKSVETLVLTGNNLTEQAINLLLKAQMKSLKNVYLSKNPIFMKKKSGLKELKERYNVYM